MKKVIVFCLLSIVLVPNSFKAQDATFDKGTTVVTAGLGFPDFGRTRVRSYYSGRSSLTVRGFGPAILKFDYGVKKFDWGHTLGLGFVLGYNSTQTTYHYSRWWNNGNNGGYYGDYTQTDKFRTITVGGRLSYHFFTEKNLDVYGNVGMGYNIHTYSSTTNDPNGVYYSYYRSPSLYYALTLGLRYYFSNNFGLYTELGWDMSAPIQAGISLKF